ncbi:hypothetical protein [Streptomyces sp. NPDC006610]|uniref:hypothetical protein n=1 Tax=Streptomyces sp. NPDC006610 TaxID=3154584 RepID=UPI0033BDBA80
MPPALADTDTDTDPYVAVPGRTHIHIGIHTRYLPTARGLAMSGPASFIRSTARRATTAGSIAGAPGAAPSGSHLHTVRPPSHRTS